MPTYRFYVDWVRHSLRSLRERIGDKEIQATLAEVSRDIAAELNLTHALLKHTGIYVHATGLSLPDDCLRPVMISYISSGSECFLNLVLVTDVNDRRHFSTNDVGYAYIHGNTVFLSWTPETGFELSIWYVPMDDKNMVALTEELDGTAGRPHLSCAAALRYGTLSELMFIHGTAEIDFAKAQRWQQRYLALVDKLRHTLTIAAKKYREQRPY